MDFKLDEEALKKDPNEVFDLLEKLGEGFASVAAFASNCRSFGCVFKALHKNSSKIVAIKQVPVDSDLQVGLSRVAVTHCQEIIKEISIMQQCDSVNIVKSYGCYFKGSDLWVCPRV